MTTENATEFFNSDEFMDYAKSFQSAYDKAFEGAFNGKYPSDTTTRNKWGEFYQRLWEALPDSPRIRYGAFFQICLFAADYCFGEDES